MRTKTEKRRKNNHNRISKNWGDKYKRFDICIIRIAEGEEREKGNEEIFGRKMTENFLQTDVRHQTTDVRNPLNTKQENAKEKNIHLSILYSNYRTSKIKKKKILREARGKNTSFIEEKKLHPTSLQKPRKKRME